MGTISLKRPWFWTWSWNLKLNISIGWENHSFAEAGSEHLLLVKGADNVGNLD